VSHRDQFFDADGRFAAAIARRTRTPYRFVFSHKEFFSSQAFLDYLVASDAATLSIYLFISQVAQFVGEGAVWEGVVPGYTLNVPHQPPGGFDAYLAQECRRPDSPLWQAAGLLFRNHVREAMFEGFAADLKKELARYADDGFGVSEFIVRNRMRNRTSINPYKVYENRVPAFTPGMTKAYWDIAGSMSYGIRQDNNFYLTLLQRHFPAALAVPVLSGVSMVKPSPWSMSFHINRVLQRAAYRAAMHPRVLRRVLPASARPFSFGPSRFLDVALLREAGDSFLDPSARIPAEGRVAQAAMSLLFHWRVWNWVQQGRLMKTLAPLAVPGTVRGDHGAALSADALT
jgi:hypothetical protein